MKQIGVIAQTDFRFHGRPVVAGELFDASLVEAVVLRKRRCVIFAPKDYYTLAMMAAQNPEPALDMPAPVEAAPEPTPTLRRRNYRRRDLAAEHA